MLRFANDLLGVTVISIDTNRTMAVVVDVLLNPNDLSISAFICNRRSSGEDLFLLPQDIHNFSEQVITVQNEEALATGEDLVKLRDVMSINYNLIGKKVVSENGNKIGKVVEYIVDDLSFKVIKLHVRPGVTRLLKESDLIIARTQVVEVNDKQIVVRDGTIRNQAFVRAGADI